MLRVQPSQEHNLLKWENKRVPGILRAASSAHRQQFVQLNGFYNRGIQTLLWLSYAVTCDGTALLLISSSSLDRCLVHSQRSRWWTMEWCAYSHIPHGSIELSNEPLPHAWPALAAGAPPNAISAHHTPSYLICLECVIGCEVERGAVLICASKVCGYGGTGASHQRKVLYLTLRAGLESVQSWPCGVGC